MQRRVAIRTSSTFGKNLVNREGRLVGDNSGVSLVRRMVDLFHRPLVVTSPSWLGASESWSGDTFDVMHLHNLHRAANDVVVVNFDVLDSPEVYRVMKKSDAWHHPAIVNFVWWNVSEFSDRVQRRMIGQSASLFPTITNSRRTAEEVLAEVRLAAAPALADRAWIEPVTLGVDVSREPEPRVRHDVPKVWYPAMFLFARKRPEQWCEIVDKVAVRTPLQAVMRLTPDHLVGERSQALQARFPWLRPEPLLPRGALPAALACTDAFLATSEDESYGLAYVEAMRAGVIGVFPDRPWARALLPDDYPLCYKTTDEAATLLHAVLTHPDVFRQALDGLDGWIVDQHDEALWRKRLPEVLHSMEPVR